MSFPKRATHPGRERLAALFCNLWAFFTANISHVVVHDVIRTGALQTLARLLCCWLPAC